MTGGPNPPPLETRAVVGLGVVSALVPLNSTMIAVALPEIADDFGIGKGSTGILVTAYLVVMLVGQPLAGRITDRSGSLRVLHASLIGFAALSALSTLAGSLALLVGARVLQAVFATALVPSTQSLVRRLTTVNRRGRAFGIMGSFIGAGAVAGPVIGGLVTELFGWQGVFLVNLPLIAIAFVLLQGLVDPGRAPSVAAKSAARVRDVLAGTTFRLSFVVQAGTTFGQYSVLLVTPLVLDERGWSSGQIGAALTALTVGQFVGPVGGRIADRHGRRLPVLAGTSLAASGMLFAAVVVEESSAGLIVAMVFIGLGQGFSTPSLITAALESVPEQVAGSAAGVLSMSRYTGSIPASLLLAVLVDGISGSRSLLLLAVFSLVLSVAAGSRLPGGLERETDKAQPEPRE